MAKVATPLVLAANKAVSKPREKAACAKPNLASTTTLAGLGWCTSGSTLPLTRPVMSWLQ